MTSSPKAPEMITTKAQATKTVIKDGHVLLAYGMDEHGLELIADEAIAQYRKLAEGNMIPMKDRDLYDEAHEDAIVRARDIVLETLAKRSTQISPEHAEDKYELEKVWEKYRNAQDVIEELERKIEFYTVPKEAHDTVVKDRDYWHARAREGK